LRSASLTARPAPPPPPLHLLRRYAQAIVDATLEFDVIFGPAYKGIPLAAVVASALYSKHGVDCGVAYNRKEPKDHGEGGVLVGAALKGRRVLLIDDVISAGTAIREAFGILTEAGATAAAVIIALDRQERRSDEDTSSAVDAVKAQFDVPVVAIASLAQLSAFLATNAGEEGVLPDTLAKIEAYRARWGAK